MGGHGSFKRLNAPPVDRHLPCPQGGDPHSDTRAMASVALDLALMQRSEVLQELLQ